MVEIANTIDLQHRPEQFLVRHRKASHIDHARVHKRAITLKRHDWFAAKSNQPLFELHGAVRCMRVYQRPHERLGRIIGAAHTNFLGDFRQCVQDRVTVSAFRHDQTPCA